MFGPIDGPSVLRGEHHRENGHRIPAENEGVMAEHTSPKHELDVRDIDGAPFSDIMATLETISDRGTLVLTSGFEPKPLYTVLEQRGFTYETTKVTDDEWRVTIEPSEDVRANTQADRP